MVVLKGSIIQLVHYKFIEPPLVLLQIPATTKTVRGNQSMIIIYNCCIDGQADLSSQSIMALVSSGPELLKNAIE